MTSEPGSSGLVPELAISATFTSPTQFTVRLRPGLKFANGHRLTSSDVVFSFERQAAIHANGGPAPVLEGRATVSAVGDSTVVFHLPKADASFPTVLAAPGAAIVDEEVFSSGELTDDATIVASHAFDGQYTIDSFHPSRLVTFVRNPHYAGALGVADTANVALKHYSSPVALRLDLQGGAVDVAEGIADSDLAALRAENAYRVVDGAGSEAEYLVFDPRTMPYSGDAAKSLIVRQAVADLVDRSKLSAVRSSGRDLPLYSFVPEGLGGATSRLKTDYGDGLGGPNLNKATVLIAQAGLSTPIVLDLEYNTTVFGPASKAEYAELKDQLEVGGLFKIGLGKADFPQYEHDRRAAVYPAYQFWARVSLPDAGLFLQQTFAGAGALSTSEGDTSITGRIAALSAELNPTKRSSDLADIQTALAAELPVLPLLQTSQVVVLRSNVKGSQLDASQLFRFGDLVRL